VVAPRRGTSYASIAAVERAIIGCERCRRLRHYCREIALAPPLRFRTQEYWGKPVPGYGDPKARMIVIGLAPAAHGGNRTGRVFTGDSSGSWLYEALHRFGWSNQPDSTGRGDGLKLTDAYVTAAARCAPPKNKPTPLEFGNCREYLEAELALLKNVKLTVTLGRLAHDQWLRASGWSVRMRPGTRPAFAHGAEQRLPDGNWLLCSYHPSRQNTNTGKLTREMWHAVFKRARALLDRLA